MCLQHSTPAKFLENNAPLVKNEDEKSKKAMGAIARDPLVGTSRLCAFMSKSKSHRPQGASPYGPPVAEQITVGLKGDNRVWIQGALQRLQVARCRCV